eukprot:gnl/Chilomastix_cuspidata/3773.p1 GENE.gnl/Chilomastix_cuspidata/3773~~gnl/Chilomastix_cuspidata/3773.p1  ORF type:complete len:275 (+),score=104.88 gnl/Chilomastix_cuspidata/3773:100-924(+)
MVLLHVKVSDRSQFIFAATLDQLVDNVTHAVLEMGNAIVTIRNLTDYIDDLVKHGPMRDPERRGLDFEDEEHGPNVDKAKFRTGFAPREELVEVARKACEDALAAVSAEKAERRVALAPEEVQHALDTLRGAVMITFPAGLPVHEPVRLLLDAPTDFLAEGGAAKDIYDPAAAVLWFSGRALRRDEGKSLRDVFGRNEKMKVVVKPARSLTHGPVSESLSAERDRREWMARMFKAEQEMHRLALDTDTSSYDAAWTDPTHLRRSFLGMGDIKFK